MDQKAYLDDLRQRSPNHDNYMIEARPYKNASGVDELIFLQKGYWDYADWLQANVDDVDIADWVIHCDQNPSEGFSLSHLLMYWLWDDHCNRFRQGLSTPNPYPPMGYKGWAEEVHSVAE